MNKQDMYRHLDELGISYEVTEHRAVFNMAEVADVSLPYPDRDAKNLFVCDKKKRDFLLVTVKGNKRVDLKELRRQQQTKALSLASADLLLRVLSLSPGYVTPLGLLNDEKRCVTLLLDEDFLDGLIGVHPCDNTATLWLQTQDLVHVIHNHGNEVRVVPIPTA